ncbi:transcription antitermination factor NusB [Candidatus Manganitrophus noduliformans]|uniref:Transcription antitermination protein NusB n=1 Tax=Candidatus Manganitrophus noduliformans TaxID=2606439 RepID=A0A7X6DRZ6_9BACT|nr:transcription antitermination factor NusB [Candidatus Manganitrophus noduliformans]NKE72298.1 transcription antitermination factor NusB [Candidatus Manganitrophus noduliformans]
MGFRRKARELALQLLFQIDFTEDRIEIPSSFWAENESLPQVKAFTEILVNGVLKRLSEIDPIIEKYTQHWSRDRMAAIDRNILRFAIFEMLYLKEIPPKVTINEAIEIAKKYGSEDSGAFVNGILDRIHRDETTSGLTDLKHGAM